MTDNRDSRAARPRVLFLGGFGRSGSTLLERLLSQSPGLTACGEVLHMWERGVLGGERCGCGEPFGQCPVWSEVGRRAFGGWDRLDVHRVLALRWAVDRTRAIPFLAFPRLRRGFRAQVAELAEVLGAVYRSRSELAGGNVLVDSGKHASYAFLLRHVPVDMTVVHVVRDSRGVGYSWSKVVRKPESVDGEHYMPTFSAYRSSLYWMANNVAFHLLALLGVRMVRVRYEDLLREPATVVEQVLRFAGVPPAPAQISQLATGSVELTADHTVAGNPMRFTTGRVELRLDEQWRERMPARDRRLVSVLTAPLQVLYGYRDRA